MVLPRPSFCTLLRVSVHVTGRFTADSRGLRLVASPRHNHLFIPCRDLYHDIAIPGGIAMKKFSEAWALFCKGMDYNDYSVLQSPAKQLLSTVSK